MRPVFDQVSETREKDPSEIPLCGSLREFHGTSGLLSIDFGMKEWNEFDPKAIVRKYRQFVYETVAAESQESGVRSQGSVKRGIDPKIVEKARKKGYKISRADRFRYRCRYSPG